MRAYADSSFLVKLVSPESGTPEAVAEFRRLNRPRLFYLSLHALEVENAIRQRAFHERRARARSEQPRIRRERDEALSRLQRYVETRAFQTVPMEPDEAIERGRELSASHAERLGARAIDILHVACALLLKSDIFLTTDERQSQLAKAAGLKVKLLRSPK